MFFYPKCWHQFNNLSYSELTVLRITIFHCHLPNLQTDFTWLLRQTNHNDVQKTQNQKANANEARGVNNQHANSAVLTGSCGDLGRSCLISRHSQFSAQPTARKVGPKMQDVHILTEARNLDFYIKTSWFLTVSN